MFPCRDVAAVLGPHIYFRFGHLMFNLFTPPCFAAIGAMNAEMGSRKWLWAAIGFQFGMGYTVAYLVYQIGTLITTGSFGNAVIPGFLAVAFFIGLLIHLMHRKEQRASAGVKEVAQMWQNIIVFLVIGAIIAGAIAKIVIDRKRREMLRLSIQQGMLHCRDVLFRRPT